MKQVIKVNVDDAYDIPDYESRDATSVDLLSAFQSNIYIYPGQMAVIPTGLYVRIPKGYELHIMPRMGLAVKHGVVAIQNALDSRYKDEVVVVLQNNSDKKFKVRFGDKIAQCTLIRAHRAIWSPAHINEVKK